MSICRPRSAGDPVSSERVSFRRQWSNRRSLPNQTPGSQASVRTTQEAASQPRVGSDFLGFHLLEVLGKGAFGTVYLARQGDLADRLVVLKISPRRDEEPRLLAQLQHTNIVPIYSIHTAQSLQVVCMPFFGTTTLQDVSDRSQEPGHATGNGTRPDQFADRQQVGAAISADSSIRARE